MLGYSPFATPTDVWFLKTGPDPVTLGGDDMTPAQEWGHRLEPAILKKYAEETGLQLSTSFDTKLHLKANGTPGAPVFATPDALVFGGGGMVDAKCTNHEDGWGERGTDDVPEHYLLQAVIQMAVFNRAWCDFAVLFLSRRRFGIWRVQRDMALESVVLGMLTRWWEDHVVGGTTPDPDDIGYLKRLPSNGSVLAPAGLEDEMLMVELRAAHASKKEAEAHFDTCAEAVKRRIGDYDGISVEEIGRVTWRSARSGRRTFRTTWEKTR